ncbi:MAG: hypothetical protein LUG18_03100 [Candidatus Azobacteroides sp.]|nr:hypothetical protein [Candidatus Azobacteroides sp.]
MREGFYPSTRSGVARASGPASPGRYASPGVMDIQPSGFTGDAFLIASLLSTGRNPCFSPSIRFLKSSEHDRVKPEIAGIPYL